MLRALPLLALLLVVGSASAAVRQTPVQLKPPVTLMPGVTEQTGVQFTSHGPVTYQVITMPRPGGLYALGPALAGGIISGGVATLPKIEEDGATAATSAGINGDFFNASTLRPNGLVMQDGVIQHNSVVGRSSIGIDAGGALHVKRIPFVGSWQGSGQRRPITLINQRPTGNQVALFTPAWGAAVPAVPNSIEITFSTFPEARAGVDLNGQVVGIGSNGGTPIPSTGAVLVGTGTQAQKLLDEAGVDGTVTVRLTLPSDWSNVTEALGGGPLLVKNSRAVFNSGETFDSNALTERNARGGIGQRADGSIILVTVDGGQPGYSSGVTAFELGQLMVKLGAVTAGAVQYGNTVAAAFDGKLLNRPSQAGGRPIENAWLLSYYGVYTPPLSVPVITASNAATGEVLTYKIVRTSSVSATLTSPSGVVTTLDSGVKPPGTYTFTQTLFDAEGTWRFDVSATDDRGQLSSVEQTFRYDLTLSHLSVPKSIGKLSKLPVRLTLTRPASVVLTIKTKRGAVVQALPAAKLNTGPNSLAWNGTIDGVTKAHPGAYVAQLAITSSVGTLSVSQPFTRRS